MSLKLSSVKEILNDYHDQDYGTIYDFMWNENRDVEVEGLPKVEFVDAWGAEGDGAKKWVVMKIADQYYQIEGYYSSWGDDEFDGELVEVKPVKVMKTEYQEV